eukprot:1235876-Amphidinium_carterae.1
MTLTQAHVALCGSKAHVSSSTCAPTWPVTLRTKEDPLALLRTVHVYYAIWAFLPCQEQLNKTDKLEAILTAARSQIAMLSLLIDQHFYNKRTGTLSISRNSEDPPQAQIQCREDTHFQGS